MTTIPEASDVTNAVACPRCKAEPGVECTFVSRRPSARVGDSMGGSAHAARWDAFHELREATS